VNGQQLEHIIRAGAALAATREIGWRDRLVRVENENTGGAIGSCLEPYDLEVSKLSAGRGRNLSFVASLLRHRLVDLQSIRQRFGETPLDDSRRELCLTRLKSLAF
jgi:hypothetical protein